MHAEIIALGDELTCGQRLDTNSQWLSQQLGDCGIRVLFHTTVGDDLDAGCEVFRQAIGRADVIVSTGGLGPTADDLTRECMAHACGVDLVRNEAALDQIRALFARRGREMPPRNAVQAMFPRGSRVIPNPQGTAPGIEILVPRDGRSPAQIFALPGVPAEMREMWTATVRPALAALTSHHRRVIRHRTIHCYGTGESAIEAMLPDLIRRGRIPTVGITASKATISLRITAEGPTPEACDGAMQPTADTIYQCLGDLVFGEDGDTLQDVVVRLLAQRAQTLSTVECGSGGALAEALSSADPELRVFRGGWVLRDPAAIAGVLGTAGQLAESQPLLTETGVQALAVGCRADFHTDYALALGPFPPLGETPASPPPVHLAIAKQAAVDGHSTPYAGHPDILLARTVKEALNFLRLRLRKGP
ncbi:MAG: CinA family nicotinamide mononucleotide deamidase-related protein [Pirellulaceae bacterium]|jgi:nicotinamide-nucleotide amidase|nr:CinA family nicotinamide mononucleotide deamidase-related protein [Pirellulaceae bacterium]